MIVLVVDRYALMRRLTVQNDVPMSAVGDNTLSAKRMRN